LQFGDSGDLLAQPSEVWSTYSGDIATPCAR
jgi:hypothetical protein